MSLKNTCASLVVVDTVILLGLSGLLSTGSRRVDTVIHLGLTGLLSTRSRRVDTIILLGLTGLLSTGSRRIGGGVENVEGRAEEVTSYTIGGGSPSRGRAATNTLLNMGRGLWLLIDVKLCLLWLHKRLLKQWIPPFGLLRCWR